MDVRCTACQQMLRVTPQANPIRVKCPKCGTLLQIPAQPGTSPASTPTQPQQPAAPQAPDPLASDPFAQSPGPAADPFGNLDMPATPQGGQFPSSPAAAPASRPQPAAAPPPKKKSGGGFPVWGYVLIVAGVLVGFPIVCCGVLGMIGLSRMKGTTEAVMTEGLAAVPPPPVFPDLGNPVKQFDSGVTMYAVRYDGVRSVPGSSTSMRIYLPAGDQDAGSVPCVLVAPAGTPLLHGASVDGGEYHDETLPYAEAGMVAIHYSIDGDIAGSIDENDEAEYSQGIAEAYPRFKRSGGGIVNGRNALEFALNKIPMVDPNKICAAGHSSAGTLALILAANEPRITHCAAYAPAYDTERRMAELIDNPMMQLLLPGVKAFVTWYSPMNHIDDFRCQMLIFHARDDSNVPFGDAERFVRAMEDAGKPVTFVTADAGEHYLSMISEGIPAAVRWLSE